MHDEKNGETLEKLEEMETKSPGELAGQLKDESQKPGGGRNALLENFSVTDIEFTKPLEWCDKTYTHAHLDFSALTGIDIEAIDEKFGGNLPPFPASSRKYQKLLAAKASKIPSDAISRLSAADYNAITNAARYFLIATG